MNINCDSLILNRIYMPIHIAPWKRSVSLLFQGLGLSLDNEYVSYDYNAWIEYSNSNIIDKESYTFVHTSRVTIAIPDVLVLTKYDKLPRCDVKFTRESVFHRDGGKCAYCGKRIKQADFSLDHINPRSRGGTNSWKNTITACKRCNGKKADRTPEEAKMPLLYQPTEPRWQDALTKKAHSPNIRSTWIKLLESVGA